MNLLLVLLPVGKGASSVVRDEDVVDLKGAREDGAGDGDAATLRANECSVFVFEQVYGLGCVGETTRVVPSVAACSQVDVDHLTGLDSVDGGLAQGLFDSFGLRRGEEKGCTLGLGAAEFFVLHSVEEVLAPGDPLSRAVRKLNVEDGGGALERISPVTTDSGDEMLVVVHHSDASGVRL